MHFLHTAAAISRLKDRSSSGDGFFHSEKGEMVLRSPLKVMIIWSKENNDGGYDGEKKSNDLF